MLAQRPGKISIGTMHLAKGLEFHAVAVMACDDEVIPSQERIANVADDADLEEVYATGIRATALLAKRASQYLADARACASGVNQPPVRIVIGEQQRPEPGQGTFGIGPADHHELLAVQAFDLEPQETIAGRIRGIDPLRDDPFQLQGAGMFVELPAAPDLVIAELQGRTRRRQQRPEALRRAHPANKTHAPGYRHCYPRRPSNWSSAD